MDPSSMHILVERGRGITIGNSLTSGWILKKTVNIQLTYEASAELLRTSSAAGFSVICSIRLSCYVLKHP